MSSSSWQNSTLFPYFLGKTDILNIDNIQDYSCNIRWTTSYPRKLNADAWIEETSAKLYEYSNGMAYIEEDCNSTYTPEFGVYGRNKIFPFIVVHNEGDKTIYRKFFYDPESSQKFYRI